MKNFNQFNLINRPFVNIGDFKGNDGNSFVLASKFRSGMKNAGYEEESEYLGGKSHSEYSNGKFDLLNMDRSFIENVVFSLAETNYEIEENTKEDDDDIIIVVKKKNKKNNNDVNYLGRGSHFYATTETMRDEILTHYDGFFEKDKVGMTVLDHYILSGKYAEYLLAVQYMVINYSPENYKDIFDNKVFGLNVIESLCEKNLLTMLHTNFAKYVLTQDKDLITSTINNVNEALTKLKKDRSVEKDKINMVKEILNIISASAYLSSQVQGTYHFANEIFSSLNGEKSQFSELFKSIENKELNSEFEKHILLSSIDRAKAAAMDQGVSIDNSDSLNINKRRL